MVPESDTALLSLINDTGQGHQRKYIRSIFFRISEIMVL